jgi:hypothetical protein
MSLPAHIKEKKILRSIGSASVFKHYILHLLRKYFVTYIRPIFEYNSILWSPVYLIDLIESVQRKCSKRIPPLSTLPFSSRLNRLNLQPNLWHYEDCTNFGVNKLGPIIKFSKACLHSIQLTISYYRPIQP